MLLRSELRSPAEAAVGRSHSLLMSIIMLAAAVVHADPGILPKGTNVTSLTVIQDGAMINSAQKVMIATLQGLVARQSPNQIYIDGGGGYTIWYNHLNTAYGIPYTTVTSPWTLLTQYKNLLYGYILYDATANSNSLN